MRPQHVVALAFGLIALPAIAMAQTPPPTKGKSDEAPGQQSGPAKKYAPGQRRKVRDDLKKPGASEYAPGQQDRVDPFGSGKY